MPRPDRSSAAIGARTDGRRQRLAPGTRSVPACGPPAAISLRNSCTNWTAIDPSPTADATRLIEPDGTSPAANTPG